MIRLGITGGIGSGKSVLSHILGCMDIPVYDCDSRARLLMNNNEDIRRKLTALVGDDAYIDGKLNVKKMSSFLFSKPENKKQIDAIVHPVVKDDFLQWAESQTTDITAVESAILFESGMDKIVDKTIMVYAAEKTRIERIVRRNNCTAAEALERIRSQMDDNVKMQLADFTVKNDGESVLLQIEKILNTIRSQITNNKLLC